VPEQMVREPSLDSIGEIVAEFNVVPENTTPDERLEIMCDLYDAGVFRLKGAVAKTAEVLHMSEQSVYRYLTRIKKARV
jgi:predicted transcriptional regulator YheO